MLEMLLDKKLLFVLMGMLTGLVCTVKNAIKAVKILHGKGGES